jgi:hypothetical protein
LACGGCDSTLECTINGKENEFLGLKTPFALIRHGRAGIRVDVRAPFRTKIATCAGTTQYDRGRDAFAAARQTAGGRPAPWPAPGIAREAPGPGRHVAIERLKQRHELAVAREKELARKAEVAEVEADGQTLLAEGIATISGDYSGNIVGIGNQNFGPTNAGKAATKATNRRGRSAPLASAYSGFSGNAVLSSRAILRAVPGVWKSGSVDVTLPSNVARRPQAAAFFLLGFPLRV